MSAFSLILLDGKNGSNGNVYVVTPEASGGNETSRGDDKKESKSVSKAQFIVAFIYSMLVVMY